MISDIVRNSSTRFNPKSISGMAAWYDILDPSTFTLDGSNNFSQLRDKGDFGIHLNQASSGSRPSYLSSGTNGKPVMRIDGTSDIISSSGYPVSTFFGSGTQQATWVYVLAYLDSDRLAMSVATAFAGTTNRMLLDRHAGGRFQFTAGSIGHMAITSAPFPSPATAWSIETVRWTNGSVPTLRRKIPGSVTTYSGPGTLTGTMAGTFQIDLGYHNVIAANFEISEWLIFNRELSNEEVTELENYLSAKWAI